MSFKKFSQARKVSKQLVSRKQKGYGQQTGHYLKSLNMFIPNQRFKMEGRHLFKDLLKAEDYMCNTFAFLCTTLTGNMYNFSGKVGCMSFFCLCFGLGPVPRIIAKLLNFAVVILRRMNIRIIICLSDMGATDDGQ